MSDRQRSKVKDPLITVWSLLRKHILSKKLISIIACLAITSGITFIRPLAVKGITDEGMLKGNMEMIVVFALFLFLCAIFEQLISVIQSRQFAVIQNAMMLSLYQSVFEKVLKLRKEYFTNHNSADIINRTTMDVRTVCTIADRSVLFTISYILAIISGMMGLFVLNWKLAFVVVAVIPIKTMFSVHMAKLNEAATEDNIHLNRKFFSWFGDIISGIKEIKLWNLQKEKMKELFEQQKEILKTSKKSVLYDSYNRALSTLVDGMVQCALYIYGGYLFLHGELTLGGVTAFISYTSYVLGPISSLLMVRYMFSNIKPSLKRLNDFFSLEESITANLQTMVCQSSVVDTLEICNLYFSYSHDDPLLTGANFTAHKGDRIAIIGQNGSGKSTLVDLILRFERPESGIIFINGKDASDFSDEQYWNLFEVVDQEPFFFQDTVRNNVDPKGEHDDDEILSAFTLSGIMGFFQDRFKGDLNRIVHFDAGDLSGGERKKLAIARAILKDSPILIMDEAAADYDFESEYYLSGIISTKFRDKIVIYITHNYSYLDRFNKVYRIERGTLRLLSKSEIECYMNCSSNNGEVRKK